MKQLLLRRPILSGISLSLLLCLFYILGSLILAKNSQPLIFAFLVIPITPAMIITNLFQPIIFFLVSPFLENVIVVEILSFLLQTLILSPVIFISKKFTKSGWITLLATLFVSTIVLSRPALLLSTEILIWTNAFK